MRVIFLDVDGVLNSVRSMIAYHDPSAGFRDRHFIDPVAVALLNRLIRLTGAVLVISSTHRKHIPDPLGNGRCMVAMQKYFDDFGIVGKVVGYTPCRKDGHRGSEIEEWINNERYTYDSITEYVIIDDDSDMTEYQLKKHFVRTDNNFGFSHQNYKDALAILNGVDIPS